MLLPTIHTVLAARALNITGNVTSTSVVLPYGQPVFAEKLSPQLAAFSIEMDRWPDWSGPAVGQPNQFVNTLLGHLSERTGAPVFLRVGADSEDHGHVDLSYQVFNETFPAPTADTPAPEADSVAIGRDFYALSGNLPQGTYFHWGVNLFALNETETLSQIKLLADTFQGSRSNVTSGVHLKYLEIGNEPDFIPQRGGAPYATFNPANYSATWAKYAKDAASVINLNGETKLSPGAFANIASLGTVWNAAACFEAGILDDPTTRSQTDQWAMHFYSGAYSTSFPVVPGVLMDKYNVRANLSLKAADIMTARASGLTYVLGETNSYANHGVPGVSNGGEAVMWGVDSMLRGASIGIDRMHFHNGRGFRYNVIQPTTLNNTSPLLDDGLPTSNRPHIMPLYHAFLIVNEAIGTNGNSYVAELGTSTNQLATYGVYENNNLVRLILINTQVYTEGTSGGRAGLNVTLAGYKSGQYATIKRFHTPYTNSTSGWTWAGQNFDTPSGNPDGQVVEEPLSSGVVELEASSVALICFK